MPEEITVKNYRRSRKFGWGWSTTPTGEDAYSIEAPTVPDYEGTLKQLDEAINNDRAFQNLGGAFFNTAWFYGGQRISHTWAFGIMSNLGGPARYGHLWTRGFDPTTSDQANIKIRIE